MPEVFWGGAERQFRYLIENANAHNVDVVLINMHLYSQAKTIDDVVFGDKNHIDYYDTIPRRKDTALFSRLVYTCEVNKRIKNVLKTKNIDTAIVYEPQGCYSIPFLKKNRIRVIYSERNTGEGVASSRLLKELVKQADVIVSNSLSAKYVLEKSLNRSVVQINNAINPSIKANNNSRDFNKIKVLVPARIAPIKNQLLVVEMLHEINDLSSINVIFAGKVEDKEYESLLIDRIHEYNLENVCSMVGYVKDMDALYNKIDVVILPSKEEGTSNVILECFAYKKPVLCSRIPMNLLNPNIERFMFSPEDPVELGEKLMEITKMDKEELYKYIDSNFEFVCREYSVSNMIESYIKLA